MMVNNVQSVLQVERQSVRGVLAADIDSVWPEVNHLIERALEYADGKMSLEDVYVALRAKEYQLWLAPGGVWVTRIIIYPQSKRLEFLVASGEWDDWDEHGWEVAAWARTLGCDAVELIGRPGWGRKSGLEEIHRTFRVRI